MEKHPGDILLKKFGEISEYLLRSEEKIDASGVIEALFRTNDILFVKAKKDNPALVDFLERFEMSFTTSLVFSISLLSSIKDDVKDFMDSFPKEVLPSEKPN